MQSTSSLIFNFSCKCLFISQKYTKQDLLTSSIHKILKAHKTEKRKIITISRVQENAKKN